MQRFYFFYVNLFLKLSVLKENKLDDVEDQEDLAKGLRAADQQMARCTKVSFSHGHPIHQQWPMVTNDVAIGHCWWTLPIKVFLKYLKLPIRNKEEEAR